MSALRGEGIILLFDADGTWAVGKEEVGFGCGEANEVEDMGAGI